MKSFASRALSVAVGVVIAVLALGYLGNLDFADAIETEARMKRMRVAVASKAELLCECPKQRGSRSLYAEIVHQPDREFCSATCCYTGELRCRPGQP